MTKLFGTNGVRGITNESMNSEFALNLGRAIGTFVKGEIIIGTDTRTSNEMLKSAVISALLSTGCKVTDIGVAPSPAIQYAVKQLNKDAGIIITASHNPPEFNGIKVIDSDGTELPKEKEEMIEQIYFSRTFSLVNWDEVGGVSKEERAIDLYIKGIIDQVDVSAIKKAQLKVIIDCSNGSGSLCSPYLLERLGVGVISLNSQADGRFPGHESEPTPENVKELIELTKGRADLGIAHDGDADRTIFIDEKGNYVHGDKTLALVSRDIVKENKGGTVVTPIATSSCVEEVVLEIGGSIDYTKVGAPIVARRMIEINAVFGGEENGGLIFPKHQYCRDGAMGMAKVLEILAKSKSSLSELIKEIPDYSLYKTKVECPDEKKGKALEKFAESLSGREMITIDGVKVFFDDGWVLVRPSGTEPIYRIFAESRDLSKAKELAEESKALVKEIIEML